MLQSLKFRLGRVSDDSSLRNLLRRNSMPGSISLSMCHDPSFFQAIEVAGSKTDVVLCEDSEDVVGMGLVSEREVFVDGKPDRVGYISRLRLDKTYRNSTELMHGYRYFKTLHEQEFKMPYYLSTIMESNTHAISMLTKRRAYLPVYQDIGGYVTVAVPVLPRLKPFNSKIHIVNGEELGIEKVVHFIQNCGREKQFYPVYKKEDILSKNGILRGLNLSDFYVAKKGDSIVALMACWDQRAFRPNIVSSYSSTMRLLRKPINFITSLCGSNFFPAPGEVISAVHAACVAVQNNDPRLFKYILQYVLADISKKDVSLFLLGFADNDPLLKKATGYMHIKVKSRIYSVSWEDSTLLDTESITYLELGSL